MERKELVKKGLQWEKATVVQVGFVAVFLFAGMVFTPINAQNTATQGKDTAILQMVEVEQLPEFPGGDNALRKFLVDNLRYPELAKAKNMQGSVTVGFIVAKDGSITEVEVRKSSGHLILDEEAVRVIKLMPKWKPGMAKGEAVNVQFLLPIDFVLSGGDNEYEKYMQQKKIKRK